MKKDNKTSLRIDKNVCCCCGVATYKVVPDSTSPIHKNRCDLCAARLHNLNEYYLIGNNKWTLRTKEKNCLNAK